MADRGADRGGLPGARRGRHVARRDLLAARAQEPANLAKPPRSPAIAVLPFANLSGDPKQDYFSDGITEDILTELSRARDIRVLARNTTFQYKGKPVDVGELGREPAALCARRPSAAATIASALPPSYRRQDWQRYLGGPLRSRDG